MLQQYKLWLKAGGNEEVSGKMAPLKSPIVLQQWVKFAIKPLEFGKTSLPLRPLWGSFVKSSAGTIGQFSSPVNWRSENLPGAVFRWNENTCMYISCYHNFDEVSAHTRLDYPLQFSNFCAVSTARRGIWHVVQHRKFEYCIKPVALLVHMKIVPCIIMKYLHSCI